MSDLALAQTGPDVAPSAAPAPALVRAVSLTKTYRVGPRSVPAVRGVDLAIRRGELVAIMGPSGCGKSTLLHMLGGLLRPTSGRLFIGERDITRISDAERTELRRTGIGFVFQSFNLFPRLTVEGNIALAQRIRYGSWTAGLDERTELLERLGLAPKAKHKPTELSGGEQQRVAIARALVHRPRLLLADEPTGNLDSSNAGVVLGILRTLNEQIGQTIVMITHNPEAAEYGTRRVWMKDGKICE